MVEVVPMLVGRLFQAAGPATLKARSPKFVFSVHLGIKNLIALLIPANILCNQFKPMGSTTVVLTDLTHIVSTMLKDNSYIHRLLVDFSKVFDSIDHCKLINKLKDYNVADNNTHKFDTLPVSVR